MEDDIDMAPGSMDPVDADSIIDISPPKRRGRQPYPRDAEGNIIRPAGAKIPRKQSSKPSPENREQRKSEIVSALTQLQPMLLQATSMMMGVPMEYCMTVIVVGGEQKIATTAIGQSLVMPAQLVDMYGVSWASFQETPAYEKMDKSLGGLKGYGLPVIAVGATALWFVGMMKQRNRMKEVVEQLNAAKRRQGLQPKQVPNTHPEAPEADAIRDDPFNPVY